MNWLANIQKSIPHFSLQMCDNVQSVCIKLSDEVGRVDMNMLMYHDDSQRVEFIFHGICGVHIPDLDCGMLSIGELFIVDVSKNGIENIRYRVGDELTGLRLDCFDVSVSIHGG